MTHYENFSANDFSAISVSDIGEGDLARLEKETFAPYDFEGRSTAAALETASNDEDDSVDVSTRQLDALRSSLNLYSPPKRRDRNAAARLLSPPDTSERADAKFNASAISAPSVGAHTHLVDQLKAECASLREINQKLIVAMNENNRLIAQLKQSKGASSAPGSECIESFYKREIDRIQTELDDLLRTNGASEDAKKREIATLRIRIHELEVENAQLKNSPLFRSPLAAHSVAATTTTQKISDRLQTPGSSTHKPHLYGGTAPSEREKLKERHQKELSAVKSNYEALLCKQEVELRRFRDECESARVSAKTAQDELHAAQKKQENDETSRLASLKQTHQQELNFVIQKYSASKEKEVAALKQKYRSDVQILATKFKKQAESLVESIRREAEERNNAALAVYRAEIDQLRAELAEKESLFVHAVIPAPESSSKSLRAEIDKLAAENNNLRSDLQSQKAAIIERLKKKFKEHTQHLKGAFDLEKQKAELNFQRVLTEKLKYLHSKYKLK